MVKKLSKSIWKKRAKKSSGAQHLESISDILKRIATTEIDITTTEI